MKWVTRENPKTDRIACPWLIRKYIDPEAEILYVPDADVLPVAEREGGISFDAPDAKYTHRDGLCSFEVLIEEHQLTDPALTRMAQIVHGADIEKGIDTTPRVGRAPGHRPWLRAAGPARPATARAGAPGVRRPLRLVPRAGERPSPRLISRDPAATDSV